MKALSIKQPWAWLIVNGFKDIENRDWRWSNFRGNFFVHASKGCTRDEYDEAVAFAYSIDPSIQIPPLEELPRGGIVGTAKVHSVTGISSSPWFVGPLGLVLRDQKPLPFVACNGMLGFWHVPAEVLARIEI